MAEYGTYSILRDFGSVTNKVKAEIYARGPVAAGVNAEPIVNYEGGIVNNTHMWNMMVNHIVSIVGWGTDAETGDEFWIVRNSWGQYWGEGGYFRIVLGKNALGIESTIAWATPGIFSVENFPCHENADNCQDNFRAQHYVDPSKDRLALGQQLAVKK